VDRLGWEDFGDSASRTIGEMDNCRSFDPRQRLSSQRAHESIHPPLQLPEWQNESLQGPQPPLLPPNYISQ